eukprot:1195726-Prorocentrum_minimum.AAC.1
MVRARCAVSAHGSCAQGSRLRGRGECGKRGVSSAGEGQVKALRAVPSEGTLAPLLGRDSLETSHSR